MAFSHITYTRYFLKYFFVPSLLPSLLISVSALSLVTRGESLLLKTPPPLTSRYGGSSTAFAVKLWNALPHVIRQSPSANVVKRKAKSF